MIIVRLKGGMGNQMFQYAFGRRLAEDLRRPLKLDITGYDNQPPGETKREYQLHHFNIIENVATPEERRGGNFARFWDKVWHKFHIGFEPQLLKKLLHRKRKIYLDGYWHSEKYFQSIRDTLIWEFNLKEPLSPLGEKVMTEIKDCGQNGFASVSLHVRRSDYASDPATLKHHGLMTTEYYGGALEIMRRKLGNIRVFVFSDDIDWVKQNIPLKDEPVYVTNPEIPFYEEVYLMSLCEHNIIANSSFSWWGAWLNQNPHKIVIASENWLAKYGRDYYKEVPESWIKI